ncbi:MAG: oligosaccharide repeat unit polymerase [Burkholderiaceae bacterium]|nr:MAG: oligosaccharide repeat unit polymerase [Burkholderiaceae bacterium]
MSELEFIILALNEWPTFVALSVLFALVLFLSIRRVIVGGVFDPLVLALVVGYSVNYAVVALLWLQGASGSYLSLLVLTYGVVMLVVFRWVSRSGKSSLVLDSVRALTPNIIGVHVYRFSIALYLLLSSFIIASIGFGVFAETNRFDAARGFGGYIRVLDFLGPFIVAYSTAAIANAKRRSKLKIALLLLFIVYAAMVNGAKISVIFSLCTVFFTLSIIAIRVRISPATALLGMAAGLAFSVLALSANLRLNNVEESGGDTALTGSGLVLERFAYRIIASGDSSYLLLPNNVIDQIATDSAFIRFLVPFIGITKASQLFGYPVGDYSVGRQALLYYDPSNEVSGGPTSHFDLFAYVYFGPVGGFLFVALLAGLLGSINRAIRKTRRSRPNRPNHFRVALLATLWTRAVLVIIEPTVALAYIVDVAIFFAVVSVTLQTLVTRRRPPAPSAGSDTAQGIA